MFYLIAAIMIIFISHVFLSGSSFSYSLDLGGLFGSGIGILGAWAIARWEYDNSSKYDKQLFIIKERSASLVNAIFQVDVVIAKYRRVLRNYYNKTDNDSLSDLDIGLSSLKNILLVFMSNDSIANNAELEVEKSIRNCLIDLSHDFGYLLDYIERNEGNHKLNLLVTRNLNNLMIIKKHCYKLKLYNDWHIVDYKEDKIRKEISEIEEAIRENIDSYHRISKELGIVIFPKA